MDNNQYYSGCTISSYQCHCFTKLSEEEKDILETKSVNVRYKKGETILKQGSFASHIMYIVSGLAKIFIEGQGNLLVLKIVPSGNLVGLTSLNEGNNTFQYSAMAYVDTEIKQIDIQYFRQLLAQNAAFAKEVINILNMNSIQINSRFFCLTYKQSYGRMADILLCLAERIFKNHEFELPLNRKEIAELSGMSTETVVRLLKKFKEEKLIETSNKYLKIIDFDRLRMISQHG